MKSVCAHIYFFDERCVACGKREDDPGVLSIGDYYKGKRPIDYGIAPFLHKKQLSLKKRRIAPLLHKKQLSLVINLDHILLDSLDARDKTAYNDFMSPSQSSRHGNIFTCHSIPVLTKLRPFVYTFLQEASKMFDLSIYTTGDHFYASEMVKLLDPKGEYFSSGMILQELNTPKHQKDLDLVPGKESATLILDHTDRVWSKYKDNLILMKGYHFFASCCCQHCLDCKSLYGSESDESEPDEGALAAILKILTQIYDKFFDDLVDDHAGRDVRKLLNIVRKEVLKGCKVVFSKVFLKNFPGHHHLLKIVEQLGGTCSTEVNLSVTHVVSTDNETEESSWALKEKKFIVHPRWIETANIYWERQPEKNFSILV